MEKSLFLSKKKKVTSKVTKQLHQLFDSGIKPDEDFWWYQKVTYLFDLGKEFVWTNTPKKFLGTGVLMGLFYFRHQYRNWWD